MQQVPSPLTRSNFYRAYMLQITTVIRFWCSSRSRYVSIKKFFLISSSVRTGTENEFLAELADCVSIGTDSYSMQARLSVGKLTCIKLDSSRHYQLLHYFFRTNSMTQCPLWFSLSYPPPLCVDDLAHAEVRLSINQTDLIMVQKDHLLLGA